MTGTTNILSVMLGDVEVGRLELESGGFDQVRFSTTEHYRAMGSRPVLSQSLEDDLNQVWQSRIRVPAYFSNLLPEGVLRELLAHRAGVNPMREFFLLAQLGEDLPGNVIIRPLGPLQEEGQAALELPSPVDAEEPLRFSVAGLQLKLSVNQQPDGWVLPVRGAGGRWLLKLPSPRFPRVPLNEFWTMRFAQALGLNVAHVDLVPVSQVAGVASVFPSELLGSEPNGLLVQRFDRTSSSLRIHTEDFLQVLNKHPDERTKYRAAGAEWMGRLVRALDPSDSDIRELVLRLVFNALVGNGDAHLKNWMLHYVDPRAPRLAPAFDLVSTIQYPATDQETFALNVGKSKRYDEFSSDRLRSFASKLAVPGRAEPDIESLVEMGAAFASRLVAEWPAFARGNNVDPEFSSTLRRHWARLPILQEGGI